MIALFKKPADAVGSAIPAVAVGLFVAFGGVIYGYDTGTISGILEMKYWKDHFSTGYKDSSGNPAISANQQSLIVSILSVGTVIGALLSAPLADTLGRRIAMLCDIVVFALGVILQTISTRIPLFIAGRFFAGLGVGLLSATIPVYQSETAPKWIRGAIVGCYQLSISIGMFIAAVVENETEKRNDSGSYRIPVAVQFAYAIILFTGMLILPETPRFFIRKGREEKAAQSLSKLRKLSVEHPAIHDELAEIKGNNDYERSLGSASYWACFQQPLRKRMITGIALQALQQLTGINFIFYYGTSYYASAGITNPFLMTVVINIISIFSVLSGVFLVERWGRRPLLLFGACGMAVSHFIIASVGVSLPGQKAANNALVGFICIFSFFFNCSWGPCAWVVTGELYPLRARGKALSMTTASNWLLNWALAYATPYMVDTGPGDAGLGSKVFFIWGGFCCLAATFVALFIFETKGLSLEQVDELYLTVNKAWKSKGFKPSLSFAIVEGKSSPETVANLEAATKRKNDIESTPSADHIEGTIKQ